MAGAIGSGAVPAQRRPTGRNGAPGRVGRRNYKDGVLPMIVPGGFRM